MDPLVIIRRHYAPYPLAYDLLLRHSERVAAKALSVAPRVSHLKPDLAFVESASLLHDIGIFLTDAPMLGCFGQKRYIEHGYLGRELLEAEGLPRHALVCERHVGVGITVEDIRRGSLPLPLRDMAPVSVEERIICYADKFFSKNRDPLAEKPLEAVRRGIEKYGRDKLDTFDAWHREFGGG